MLIIASKTTIFMFVALIVTATLLASMFISKVRGSSRQNKSKTSKPNYNKKEESKEG